MKKVIKKGGFLRDTITGGTPASQEKDHFNAGLFFVALMLSLPLITLFFFAVIQWV